MKSPTDNLLPTATRDSSVPAAFVLNVERGEKNISLSTVLRVANALGIRLSDLFGRAEEGNGKAPKVNSPAKRNSDRSGLPGLIERVIEELQRLGWQVLPSQANFILATVPGGRGREAYLGLKQQGILVRYFDLPGLDDKLRITIGTSQENNALLSGIKALSIAEKAA